jgi:hypothetical protein
MSENQNTKGGTKMSAKNTCAAPDASPALVITPDIEDITEAIKHAQAAVAAMTCALFHGRNRDALTRAEIEATTLAARDFEARASTLRHHLNHFGM